jgi:hypothetical protein
MFVDYSILWKRAVHHVYMHMYMYMLHAGARPLRQQELHHLVERRRGRERDGVQRAFVWSTLGRCVSAVMVRGVSA